MPERLFLRLHDEPAHGPESTLPAGSLRVHELLPALRPWLAGLMSYREDFGDSDGLRERVIPDAALRLVLPLDGSGGALLIGLSTKPALLPLRGRIEGLSLTLRPGAARSLLGDMPASELCEQTLPLADRWGGEAERLQELLLRCPPAERALRLQQALLALLRRQAGPPPDESTAKLVQLLAARADQLKPVSALVEASGLSERRLQQRFAADLGLPPKRYSRLLRLHGLLRRLRGQAAKPDWAALALDHGFADQSHLVHEFRRFTGLAPSAWPRCGFLQDGAAPPA